MLQENFSKHNNERSQILRKIFMVFFFCFKTAKKIEPKHPTRIQPNHQKLNQTAQKINFLFFQNRLIRFKQDI